MTNSHDDFADDPLYNAILTGDADESTRLTKTSLDADADPQILIRGSMIPAMDEAGRRFENHEYYVPELLIAARAMKSSLELIRPRLAQCGVEPEGRIVIGTVKGDLHDIGKGLVASMLEGGGFDVIDLGVDVPAERFVEEATQHNADVIAVSALLTTTMTAMKDVIAAVQASAIADRCKVMIGGAPVSQQFADTIGADGYSANANSAVALARSLVATA